MTSPLAPLRHRAFRLLVGARATSMLGNGVAPIALAFAVLDLTGSVTQLGLVVGARSLANVLLVLVGGVVADRLPRQRVLVGSSLAAGASQSVVAALVLTRSADLVLLLTLSALNGAAAAFAYPASTALLPETVPAEQLQRANALSRLTVNGALVVGASAGGVLVAVVGPGWGLVVDAISFVVAAALFAGIGSSRVGGGAARAATGVLNELRLGWGEFRSRSWVWVVVAAFMAINAASVGGEQVLGPVVADRTIGRAAWGLVLGVQTAGMVAGGLVALRLQPRRPLLVGMLCAASAAILLLALAIAPTLPALLAGGVVAGVALEQFGVVWDTALQQHIPADRLARVASYDALGSFLAIPLGEAVVGPVAAAVGVRETLLGLTGLIVVAVAASLLDPGVRRLQRGAQPQPQGALTQLVTGSVEG